MTVQISDLARHYGCDAALASIDLEIAGGEFLALLGPSGAGKTTLLRLIAGLDRPDSGAILIDGVDVRVLAPRERRIGFVFQNYALFRHMTVARNIAFGLSVRPRRERPPRARIAARVAELLDLMQLSGLGERFPAQLSGGQRQRVALARALAIEPKVLLLDEPFGALDAQVRGELRDWLHGLQRQLGLTTIFVTHDQHEAFQLAGRVAILNRGRIEQVGTPSEIHAHPASAFVRSFVGAGGHAAPPVEHLDFACRCAEGGETVAVSTNAPAQSIAPSPADRQAVVAMPQSAIAAVADVALIDRPAWTPRIVPVTPLPEEARDDLPAMAAGELWLIELADANAEPGSLERDALIRANVIIYDRALTDVVATVMSLGGYAEPTDGDGLARSLQFIRDGWSVVRLVERPSSDDPGGRFQRLAQQLRKAGVFPGCRFRRLSEKDGRWVSVDDGRFGDAPDPAPACGSERASEVIVISAFDGAAPRFYAVASNGLAG